MIGFSRYEPALWRILGELRPYLDDVVIIGGWVPYLYRKYGGFASWTADTSQTIEVDVLVGRSLPADGRRSIPEILVLAGFEPAVGTGGAAVWTGDVQAGEVIEFLVPHAGTSHEERTIVPVVAQDGMGALPLGGLDLMRQFKQKLTIAPPASEKIAPIEVCVPTLGAYTINKASTFSRRQPFEAGGNPKQAKDLLYLRDLMAAGTEVVARIESDLGGIARDGGNRRSAREKVRRAGSMLDLALRGALQRVLPEVGAMLREREPAFTDDAALADIRGHLADLVEILDHAAPGNR